MPKSFHSAISTVLLVGGAGGLILAGCGGTVTARETTPVRIVAMAPAPAPAPAPAVHRRVAMESNRLRVDEKILFERERAIIRTESDALLQEIAAEINAHPEAGAILVEGHTDRWGTASFNRSLSRRRAAAVVERLVRLGVAVERLTPVGHGFARPVAPNDTDEGRALNRRVEFNLASANASASTTNGASIQMANYRSGR